MLSLCKTEKVFAVHSPAYINRNLQRRGRGGRESGASYILHSDCDKKFNRDSQVLAAEQRTRPDITIEKLNLELGSNPTWHSKEYKSRLRKEYAAGEASASTAFSPVT